MNPLEPFDTQMAGLLARIGPSGRRTLARDLSRQLRASQSKRIAAQQNPDGSAYAPRKNTRLRRRKGAIRRQMFSRLRTARWLKVEASPNAAVVAFAGRVQHMAQVHQYGLRDRVGQRGGPEIDYPVRQLLGLTATEMDAIGERVLAHLAGT